MNSDQFERSAEMSPVSEARLWKTLDGISSRLGAIESKLNDIGRLEERVKAHDNTLSRYGSRLDDQEIRIRANELWQANFGDRSKIESELNSIRTDLDKMASKVSNIKDTTNINKGQKDVVKEILKWFSVIISGVLVYTITRG